MKVKVYVVDLEIPAPIKKWALRIGIPVITLAAGGVAFAGLPGGYADGQPLTKAELDANFNYLQNEITTLQGQVHPASAFRATRTTALSIPDGETEVAFDNVLFDLAGEYDPTSGVFTPKNSGVYLVSCGFEFAPTATAPNTYWAALIRDGANEIEGTDIDNSVPGLGLRPLSENIAQLSAGDQITCVAYQDTGVDQSISLGNERSTFAAARLY